ncbi:MAG: permease-like cell division protein FtsX [Acetivibrionales bacterium]|jgi:cell division transport system permease protein
MKIRTLKLLVKEGTNNVVKNKLMSFASIMTVVATLFFLGIILLIAINITTNIEAMKRDLKITVFLNIDVSPFHREEVISFIEEKKEAGVISEYTIVSKEQMYEDMKEILNNDALLKGFTVDNMAESFEIKVTDPNNSDELIEQISEFKGVNNDNGIGYGKDELDKLEAILKVFNYIVMAVLAVLMVVSVFLISNTIRLTVFARRRQIEIMKYVGALDSFIRWPFIVEGLLIGFIGAVLSFLITSQAYSWLQNVINVILANLNLATLRVLEFSPVALRIFIIYAIFGVIIGGIGSFLSVRKHLNV